VTQTRTPRSKVGSNGRSRTTSKRPASTYRRKAYPTYVRVMAGFAAMALIVGIVLALVISGGH
jgi:hypothetical protein